MTVTQLQPSPDWNLVTLKWAATTLDGKPCTGNIDFTYNSPGPMLDDDPVTPISIYPTVLRAPITTKTVMIWNGATDGNGQPILGQGEFQPREVGYVEVRVPASNDPDIIGSGGTYSFTENLSSGGRGARTNVSFVADKDAANGVIWLNRLPGMAPEPGQPYSAVYVADFNALKDRVTAVEQNGGGGGGVTAEQVEDIVGALFTRSTHVGASTAYGDNGAGSGTLAITVTGGGGGGTTDPEVVRDTLAAALRQGTSIAITVDDANDTITIGVSGLSISQVTNLQNALDGKVPTTRTVAGKPLSGDVTLAKADVGLGQVDNTSDSSKPVSTAQAAALAGKADLVNGVVPGNQLPGFVDDVLEFSALSAFPATGESGKLYVALDTAKLYRWSGSAYVVISDTIALGETSSTAYRGDRGKTAYDHSQDVTGNPHQVTKAQVGLSNVQNTADADKPVSTATQQALDQKANLASATSVVTAANLVVVGTERRAELYVTALAEAATVAAPSGGAPINGAAVLLRIKDDGTARALTWNAVWRGLGLTLPSTTTAGKTMYVGARYNSADSRWDVLSIAWED